MRPSTRTANQLRSITITRRFTKHAEGSVLVEFGDTKVLCTATVTAGVPRFLKEAGQGWITAEYSMLPRATVERTEREAAKGKQGGRTIEIQRLIGRSLRAAVDMKLLGDNTVVIDCDVIQADGGTRTAAITGGCVALADAMDFLVKQGRVQKNPLRFLVAAVSVGLYQGELVLDLDYAEDSKADTDMNIIMTEQGNFIEVQGTAEQGTFRKQELQSMLELAEQGVQQLFVKQRQALASS